MFVEIADLKSPLAVENILTPYKKGRLSSDKKSRLPKEKITPAVCFEILRSTNYARNIKDMLECMRRLSYAEQAQFKEVVLATFTQREQPQAILDLSREFAIANRFEREFDEVRKIKEGVFLSSAAQKVRGYISSESSFVGLDFSTYDKLVCVNSEIIKFAKNVKFSEQVEFPNSSEVFLQECDLYGVKSLLFKEGATVKLGTAKNLPPQLDVSMCNCVHLEGCDLSKYSHLIFKDDAAVWLSDVRYFPSDLDVSRCSYVNLAWCDLKEQTNLRFKDGASVSFWGAMSFPDNFDVSNCVEVNLVKCDLSNLSQLKFMKGATVYLDGAHHLPQNLDFSMCQNVALLETNFDGVKSAIFKNRQQMQDSGVKLPENWSGELVFADEISSSHFKNKMGKFIGKMLGRSH